VKVLNGNFAAGDFQPFVRKFLLNFLPHNFNSRSCQFSILQLCVSAQWKECYPTRVNQLHYNIFVLSWHIIVLSVAAVTADHAGRVEMGRWCRFNSFVGNPRFDRRHWTEWWTLDEATVDLLDFYIDSLTAGRDLQNIL